MSQEETSKTHKNWVLIVCFISGFGVGIMAMILTGAFGTLAKYLNQYAAVQIGKILDTDFIYLRNGDLIRGRIIAEEGSNVLVEFGKGSAKFRINEIERIEKNYYTRYVRGMR